MTVDEILAFKKGSGYFPVVSDITCICHYWKHQMTLHFTVIWRNIPTKEGQQILKTQSM